MVSPGGGLAANQAVTSATCPGTDHHRVSDTTLVMVWKRLRSAVPKAGFLASRVEPAGKVTRFRASRARLVAAAFVWIESRGTAITCAALRPCGSAAAPACATAGPALVVALGRSGTRWRLEARRRGTGAREFSCGYDAAAYRSVPS